MFKFIKIEPAYQSFSEDNSTSRYFQGAIEWNG